MNCYESEAKRKEEIRKIKEAAWNEGHSHCFHVEDPNNHERNPYSKEK